jgi:sulfate transport system ATP-binding protein
MSITVNNITKRFGGFTALGDVSLAVEPGEFLALLGPSGSGKTTLLRIMAGLDFPDAGSVLFDGEDVTGQSVSERGVGFVFQHYALFRHMTVADNVAFGLTVKKRRDRPAKAEIDARVAELLDLVQLGTLGGRYPAQLSGGQRQRVALARALAVRPRILLLDEPFGALDAKVRKDLRRWLRELHDRMGLTSIFVTHDQEEALELVYQDPASAFVFDFVGESNRLPVTVADGRAVFRGQALATGLAGAGEGTLFFRPHDAEIVEDGEALPAVVTLTRPRGGAIRVEAAVDGLSVPLEVDVAPDKAPHVGDRVAIRPTRVRLYTDDAPCGA